MDIPHLIQTIGYPGITLMTFTESGLVVGAFLPGDSLMITSGLLAHSGYLSLPVLLVIVLIAGFSGNEVGYYLGRKYGKRVFEKYDNFVINKENLQKAEHFYNTYGTLAIIISRFLPIVRSVSPILAGAGRMDKKVFFLANLCGALLWGCGLILLGYFLGSLVPDLDRYILPIALIIIVISVLPVLVKVMHKRKHGRNKQ